MKAGVWLIALVAMVGLGMVYAQEEAVPAEGMEGLIEIGKNLQDGLYAIAAALAVGLAAIGAGYGIGHTGSAALGAISEKPESSTWALIFVALAEGIALYGLIIAFLVLTGGI